MKKVILGIIVGVFLTIAGAFCYGVWEDSQPLVTHDHFTIFGQSYDVVTFDNSSYVVRWK